MSVAAAGAVALLLVQASPAGFPEAPERALVMNYCVDCHSVERVSQSGGTPDGWQDRIRRMVRWGARIPADRISAVAAYLARAYPVRMRPPAEQTYFADVTMAEVLSRPIQVTVRAAAVFDAANGLFRARLDAREAEGLRLGQRTRIFSPGLRMSPATTRMVELRDEGRSVLVLARPMSTLQLPEPAYIMEIVVERRQALAVPNVALIYDGSAVLVYVRDRDGAYTPRQIELGEQGEGFSEVRSGLLAGEQIVATGGFFIDAQYRIDGRDRLR